MQNPGKLPPWNVADLPAAPAFTFKNVIAVIGPGTIALSMSIGGGEWLLGPASVVKYGPSIMWIVTLGILFQLALNLECVRYTLYTGEPTMNGFMRTSPAPWFWAILYICLGLLQVGWPAWAANSASSIFAAVAGQLPDNKLPNHVTIMRFLGIGTFLVTIVIVAFGGKIERMLEWVNWFMVLFIVLFLLVVDIMFVPFSIWVDTALGHFKFGFIPQGADWVLLGAVAGFAGNGGIGNIFTSNWIRDKGFGMGSVVGYIPSAVGGKMVKVSPIGSVFPPTEENMSRWRVWWKYVHMDQTVVWAIGCFLGMYLNVILASAIMPSGTDMGSGLSPGANQAKHLADEATKMFSSDTAGKILWFMTLLNGFWILFGTQINIVEGFVRFSTDIFWGGSERVRNWAKGDIRRVYYTLLIVFALWGCIAINAFEQFTLFKIAANVAGFILVVAGIHILVLNQFYLPKEVRGPAFIRVGVVLAVLFYTFFSIVSFGKVGEDYGLWNVPWYEKK